MAQRNFLHSLAAERKGILNKEVEEKKGDFAVSSISSFREKMLREEKMSHSTDREQHKIQEQVSATSDPEATTRVGVPGGVSFF